ncbi:GntR family transcriptional regulator [Levilactobacillus suantsaii]|uniref:GntR family transcriptional regulator n=1 Tax=Levilactobacillus suantsaii TaxID=2292255 RepID=A0A4Q0VKI7_9LACO|nr:GntR family transcriptional regulator [Levilactobacillus suantsaii]QMU07193.1 GntR family transcriptional regulator [Levilactobacillus suantsaii]RXI80034.1 GntR family transcriptional regulator [Levilactobacillus suantsaii]
MLFDDKVPIYYQIKNYLYHRIVAGDLQLGDKLPAVRQLAVDLTVNVNTVQRALREMIAEGYIVPQRGRGNFVTADAAKITTLKHELLRTYSQAFYRQLHALKLSDTEILQAIETYIEKRRDADD